jgi:putative membrane protein
VLYFLRGDKVMHWGDYGWGVGFGLGWFFMVIFWVLVILGIVYLVKLLVGAGARKKGMDAETPVEILKKRYAKGEITKEQFDEMKEDITKG